MSFICPERDLQEYNYTLNAETVIRYMQDYYPEEVEFCNTLIQRLVWSSESLEFLLFEIALVEGYFTLSKDKSRYSFTNKMFEKIEGEHVFDS